jgi:ABC-type molybdate transport system substrate-binding protein
MHFSTPSHVVQRLSLLLAALLVLPWQIATAGEPIRVFAAGSLSGAFASIAERWRELHPDQPVDLVTGPAGWLRERIEKGDAVDVYASAALAHAEALNRAGLLGPAVIFTRNTLCALVKADSPLTSETIIAKLLDPDTRIATSTPKSDPGGDYTWEFFHRLDQTYPGAYAALNARAQQRYGAPPQPGKPAPVASSLITEGQVDVAIQYCSSSRINKSAPVKSIALPPPSPMADYGMAVAKGRPAAAAEFAMFVLSPAGQKILADYGFMSVGLPSP